MEFEPVSLQTQIPFNGQTKVQFKIPRIRNRSNPQKKRPLDQKTLPKSNNHGENQQKRRKEKRRQPSKKGRGFGRLPSFFFPPFLLVFFMIV